MKVKKKNGKNGSSEDMGNIAASKKKKKKKKAEEEKEMAVISTRVEGETSELEARRTVMVGVRMDAQSKELLTWALVKVAQSGDRVVALHFLPNSSKTGDEPSSLLSLVASFDSILSVYNGFCNLKQIDLSFKLCRGSSLRKALVREAAAANAAQLVLGVAKISRVIGSSSSISIAKYCAKKVSGECGVAAVNNGKVVFERSPSRTPLCPAGGEVEGSSVRSRKIAVPLDVGSNDDMFCLLKRKAGEPTLPSVGDVCSVCSEVRVPEQDDCRVSTGGGEVEEGPEEVSCSMSDRRSVAQWAIRIPGRSSTTAAIHPARKSSSKTTTAEKNEMGGVGVEKENGVTKFSRELEYLGEKYASILRLFTSKELSDSTVAFSAENLIGKGGNSIVYKGSLPDGKELAVKVLKQTEDSVKEFGMELEMVTSLRHENIVSLVGFGFDDNRLFLAYDLYSRGSLDRHLHDMLDDYKSTLGWDERYKIATGIAEALEYLHGGCGRSQPAIHRDVKSSNILLSEDFKPRLSDFGFATWSSSSSSIVPCANVAGTFGYFAPEYFLFGKVNEKIDVYAFGVVMLELLTGREPIGKECPKGQESLVAWANPFLQSGKAEQLLDPRLGTKYDADQVEQMILATALCTRRAPKLRPQMSLVVKLLLGDDDTIKSARSQVGASKEELEGQDDEAIYPALSNLHSHLSLALLDIEDDSLSLSSTSPSVSSIMARGSLEAYLQGRCISSSGFD